jgi:hypothetical protein
MQRRNLILPTTLAIALACGSGNEASAPTPQTTTEVPHAQTAAAGAVPAKEIPAADLPKGFPKDAVPLPAGAKVVSYSTSDPGAPQSFTLRLGVLAAATEAHRQQLQQAGYKLSDVKRDPSPTGVFEGYEAEGPSWKLAAFAIRDVAGSEDILLVLNVSPTTPSATERRADSQ